MSELRNIVDATVTQRSPATNYASSTKLTLRGASGDVAAAFLKASGMPSEPGAVIDSAVWRVFSAQTMASTTVELRQVTSNWNSGSVKWSNRPTSTAVIDTVTQAAVNGTPFDFDVTALVAAWAAGSANYGIRLDTTATATAGRLFHSANAAGSNAQYKPVLIIEWSARPATPDGFVATDGARVSIASPTLPWNYSDGAGLPMVSYQFQSNATDSWTAPAYDSGEVPSSVPQHTLTSPLSDGADLWYRVQHKNSAGKWSDWSAGQFFGRTSKPSLTITNPSGGTVGDYSPTYTWALGAGVQTGYLADTLNATTLAVIESSGDRAGADNDYEAANLPVQPGDPLRLRMRVRDDVDRVATPGDPVYIEATADFTIDPVISVAPVTALAVTEAPVGPFALVSWTCAVADSFIGERRVDGGAWTSHPLDLGDVSIGGSNYEWVDDSATPQRLLEYRIRPVVNGEMGDAPDIEPITLRPMYIWLVDPDDSSWVLPLAGQDAGTWGMGEQSAILEVRGADRVNLIHEGFRGYEGSISGTFHSGLPRVGGATAQELRDRAWRLKSEPTKVWRLVLSDMNIPVVVRNVVPAPTPAADLSFVASLDFFQQGELAWS